MNLKVKVAVTDGTVKAAKAMVDLTKLKVYVGIPESAAARKGGEITNAQLAYLHTHGVRAISARIQMGAMMVNRKIDYDAALKLYLHSHGSMAFQIPPRPVIEPAIEANKEPICLELKKAAISTLDHKKPDAITHLKLAGMTGQNAARAWFTDPRNHWAPNAPSTIARKGSDKPLIDTGDFRKSITYVLSEE